MTKENDGRIKLTDDDRENIQRLYKVEHLPIRQIARLFEGKCSRRSIQYIIFPERLEVVKKRQKEVKRWEAYNTKEIRKNVMRKYRAKLKKVYGIVGRYEVVDNDVDNVDNS